MHRLNKERIRTSITQKPLQVENFLHSLPLRCKHLYNSKYNFINSNFILHVKLCMSLLQLEFRRSPTSTNVLQSFVERSENIEENVFSALVTIENAIDLQYSKKFAQSKIPFF